MSDGLEAFFSNHPKLSGEGLIVAYSGGVDSASLLTALAQNGRQPLRAVHVVHNLRPAGELEKERDIVVDLCRKLDVPLTVATVKAGSIQRLAKEGGIGIEAAARAVRYGILKCTARRFGFGVICTAHNADDNLETLIGRFLSSSSIDGLTGIEPVRDLCGKLRLARPFLFASRMEIERFAESENLRISTDSTNASTDFTRNRIRHSLVPILDKDFPGWRKGLLETSVKLASDKVVLDNSLRETLAACAVDKDKNEASIDLAVFTGAPTATRIRVLARCCGALSGRGRLSFRALKAADDSISAGAAGVDLLGTRLLLRDGRLKILPVLDFKPEDRYFFQIPIEGLYCSGPVEIRAWWEKPEEAGTGSSKEKGSGCLLEGSFSFPLIVRSRKAGDMIKTADGPKRLDDIMKSWRLEKQFRNLVPVIEDRTGIVAVLASTLEGAQLRNEKFRDYAGSRNVRRLYIRIKGA